MKKQIGILSSTIGRKLIMAATGLFLCSFLLVHLSGNLLLFKSDGGRRSTRMRVARPGNSCCSVRMAR
jgi:hypothetical protein